MLVVVSIAAVISDIDSDYTSDGVNFPLASNHHNNIPLHQLGGRKARYLPPNTFSKPDTAGRGQLREGNNRMEDTDYNHNGGGGDFLSDGDYEPSNDYTSYHGGDNQFGEQNNQRSLELNGYGRTTYYEPNVSHEHWEANDYLYEEYPDHPDHPDQGSQYLYDVQMERPDRPTPMNRVSNSNSPSPTTAKSPVPKPRKSALTDKDNSTRQSPHHDRRSDTSEPFSYNSRPG